MKRTIDVLIIALAVGFYFGLGWASRGACGLMIATEHPTAVTCLIALPPVSSNLAGQIIGIAFLAVEAYGFYWLIKRWRFSATVSEEK